MTKYILHGGYTSEDNSLNDKFFKEITRELEGEINILLVYFASEESEYESKFRQDKEKFLTNSENKNLRFEIANEYDFIEQIKRSNVIYIRGGDTFKLLEILKSYPEFPGAIEGKTVTGSSAGVYVLSRIFYSRTKERIFKGLDILPIAVACHFKGDQNVLKLLEEKAEGTKIILLDEFEHQVLTL